MMIGSRRSFLRTAAAVLGSATASAAPMQANFPTAHDKSFGSITRKILALVNALPGEKAIKIFAPAVENAPELLIQSNSAKMMFVGSAIKTFVLCEALRQSDSPSVVQTITDEQLALNASVWSADSQTFNPPNLSGQVTERTALEAMIMHSDNTATDMCLQLVGPANVRSFIASAGLNGTLIPDSTRIFFGYLFGAPDYKNYTWDELQEAIESDAPFVNPPLNDVETLASSADDFVSYYSRALQGQFFQHQETLNEFRRILSLGDAIWLVPFPLGVSAFCKGGSIDTPGFHCICVPGAMFFSNRWVYFAAILNWPAPELQDPATYVAFAAALSEALTLVKNALD
jgi:beta-lactamase class A